MPKIKEHFSGVSKRQKRRLVTTNFKRLQQSITKDVELKYQKTTPHLLNLNSNQCNIKPINETDTHYSDDSQRCKEIDHFNDNSLSSNASDNDINDKNNNDNLIIMTL